MKLIGYLESGHVLIEMTSLEWEDVQPRREDVIEVTPQNIEGWYARFTSELAELWLSKRVYRSLTRSAHILVMKETDPCKFSNHYYRRQYETVVSLFTAKSVLMTFEEWIDFVPHHRQRMRTLEQFGDAALMELLGAIDRYRERKRIESCLVKS